jgi:sugar phosphate isomerase/epimerase
MGKRFIEKGAGMIQITRRRFLSHAAAASAGLAACAGGRPIFRPGKRGFLSELGVCAALGDAAALKAAGADYLEEGVQRFLVPAEPDDVFRPKLAEAGLSPLPVRACNSFLPGSLKSVGPDAAAGRDALLRFARTAFRRAHAAGVRVIVFGSGGSRAVPEGFDRSAAEAQFLDLCRTLADPAAACGVTLALEPLNRGEVNFVNSVAEGMELVRAVDKPAFRLLADLYHMMREDEGPEILEKAGDFLVHCHVAERENRTPPGVKGDDFRPYLRALRRAGYGGRMSIECRWEDLAAQAGPALAALRRQIGDVS